MERQWSLLDLFFPFLSSFLFFWGSFPQSVKKNWVMFNFGKRGRKERKKTGRRGRGFLLPQLRAEGKGRKRESRREFSSGEWKKRRGYRRGAFFQGEGRRNWSSKAKSSPERIKTKRLGESVWMQKGKKERFFPHKRKNEHIQFPKLSSTSLSSYRREPFCKINPSLTLRWWRQVTCPSVARLPSAGRPSRHVL